MEGQVLIPNHEIELVFVRGTGPGGQNVNKTSTKVQLRWNIDRSMVFSDKQKTMIRHALRSRMNKEGEIVIQAGDTRSQSQNRETAIERLERLVTKALVPHVRRIPTRPTRSSREARLESKKRRGLTKALRKNIDE